MLSLSIHRFQPSLRVTDSLPCHPAYWASLNRCLHEHYSVISSDLRLQATHAAFQLQLATFHALHPHSGETPARPGFPSLRFYLESLLHEVGRNLLAPLGTMPFAEPPMISAAPSQVPPSHLTLLEQAETTVRYLRDNPHQWTHLGLAALQVRALADLQNAYALETGILAPSGDFTERAKLNASEISRLISQELDPLVGTHEAANPEFVADYQMARNPRHAGPPAPATASRVRTSMDTRKEVSLPN